MAENTFYFNDNLKILRDNISDETLDLIYFDPPFNSKAMKEEAAALGFYQSLGTAMFPQLQTLTIKALLDGAIRARYPDVTHGGLTFKKAKKEKVAGQLTFGDEVAS